MKKTIIFIVISLNILLLSGCRMSIFEKKAPDFDDYAISNIDFDEYTPSLIEDAEDIPEEKLAEVTKANITVKNINYNNMSKSSNDYVKDGNGVIFYETEKYYYALTNYHIIEKKKSYDKQIIEVYDYKDNKYDGFIYEGSLKITLDLTIIVFEKQEELTVIPILDGHPEFRTGLITISKIIGKSSVVSYGYVKKYERNIMLVHNDSLRTFDFLSMIHTAEPSNSLSGGMILNHDLKLIGVNYSCDKAVTGDIISNWLTRLFDQGE